MYVQVVLYLLPRTIKSQTYTLGQTARLIYRGTLYFTEILWSHARTSGRKEREETVWGVWIKKAEGGCKDSPYGRETKTSDKRSPVTYTQKFSSHHPSHLQLPASLCSLLGRYDNPMTWRSQLYPPQSGTMNLAFPFLYAFHLSVVIRYRHWLKKEDISFPSSDNNGQCCCLSIPRTNKDFIQYTYISKYCTHKEINVTSTDISKRVLYRGNVQNVAYLFKTVLNPHWSSYTSFHFMMAWLNSP